MNVELLISAISLLLSLVAVTLSAASFRLARKRPEPRPQPFVPSNEQAAGGEWPEWALPEAQMIQQEEVGDLPTDPKFNLRVK